MSTARLPLLALVLTLSPSLAAGDEPPPAPPPIDLFFEALTPDEVRSGAALDAIAAAWRDDYATLFVELAQFFPERPSGPRSTAIRKRLVRFLERQTGQRFGHDLQRWQRWIWSRPHRPHPEYVAFKSDAYAPIDPRMRRFFHGDSEYAIRLDQVVWGGVRVNGIPPLLYPDTLTADRASYLKDDHVVFGLVVDGRARAYPKRILAWHEMARDRLGGVELTIVYCTLCGTVIPYESELDGTLHRFGTSGFLYRSNKLMFDEATHSLWSTTYGRPVGGPLVGSDLQLRSRAVVTTTWGEWRASHPDTTVLSLDTGHRRDYDEGVAYSEYFATDELMFHVPETDRRLKNKDEVLVFPFTVLAAERGEGRPLAIATRFLDDHRLYTFERAGRRIAVVTSPGGANRAYELGEVTLVEREGDRLKDATGATWTWTEEALVPEGDASPLPRIPAHRAFWFGWYAQHADTELVR